MHIGMQNEDQTKYTKHNSWQSKEIKHRAPTKAQFITHELVSQILCFRIMKNSLLLMQDQEDRDYLWTEMELKLFEWICLKIGGLGN